MKAFLSWLKSLFIHPKEEKTEMSEENTEVTENETPQPVAEDSTDAVLAKLKELVSAAGQQAHTVIDDLIALAKKLV